MSDVFKVRFDGREWWGRSHEIDVGEVIHLFPTDPETTSTWPRFTLPAHMVERIEDDLPPEPTETGTVRFDRDDVAWRLNVHGQWLGVPDTLRVVYTWDRLSRERGPLHPYPRAARDEIERLTAQRDGYATLRDQYVDQITEERDNLRGRIDALQARIFRARKAVAAGPHRMAEILRGES